MSNLREYIRKLILEVVQIPTPKPGERMVHKVEEDITEEMLEDVISILPIWEAGEYEQAEALMQDLHHLGRLQIHNLMNAAEEMKNYGQVFPYFPEWVSDYFEEKLVASVHETKHRLRKIIKEEIGRNYHTIDPTSYTWDDYSEVNLVTRVDPHEEKWYAKVVVKNRPDLSTREQVFSNEEEATQWGRNLSDKIRVMLMNKES